MTKISWWCLLIVSLAAMPAAATEQLDPQKLAAIRELLQVTGAATNAVQFSRMFTGQILSVLRSGNPDIPDKAVRIVSEEVNAMVEQELKKESLQQEIYPIYAKHFTLEELNALIAFNKTPIGRKANRVMPALIQESLAAGQKWAEKVEPVISERIRRRFEEEGIRINSPGP
jgi:hypothetical protein